jgi:sec-independent protein translocase protein TatA
MIGTGEIIIVVVVVVLLFGSTQIPKLAKSIGEGMKEMKKAMKEAKDIDTEDKKPNVNSGTDQTKSS